MTTLVPIGKPHARASRLRVFCAASLCVGLTAWLLADGESPQTEVYDGLAGTSGTQGFWDTSGYSGSLNSIGTADCGTVVLGSGAASDASATTGVKGFEPFSAYALESPARGLNSREPSGVIIQIY